LLGGIPVREGSPFVEPGRRHDVRRDAGGRIAKAPVGEFAHEAASRAGAREASATPLVPAPPYPLDPPTRLLMRSQGCLDRPSQLPPASGLSWIRDLLEEVLEDVFNNAIDVLAGVLVRVFLPDVLTPIRFASREQRSSSSGVNGSRISRRSLGSGGNSVDSIHPDVSRRCRANTEPAPHGEPAV
jgi:hypothetical protein